MKQLLFLSIVLFSSVLLAQTVTGTVSDSNGPLPGVTIIEKGTTNGTTTDFDGNYSIDVGAESVLTFSFIGFTTQEIAVNGQSTINVQLAEDANELDEVVVIGYGSIRAKDATGSVASVKSKDFNGGVIASPEQLIQGKTAGVQITTTSGEPGAGMNIRIRGTSSVRSGNGPLYVVDGVPLSGANTSVGSGGGGLGSAAAKNPLNFLNPNDIASMDILKDASATAIYGSRGANGVVLITTKSGKAGRSTLEFSSSVSSSAISKRVDLLDRESFLATQATLGNDITVIDRGADTDWQDVIFRNALSTNYDLSYGGGGENGNFRLSVGYTDQEGMVENSGLKRLTTRFNSSQKFFEDKLKMSTQITVSNTQDERAPISDNAGSRGDLLSATYYANPTAPVYGNDGLPSDTGSSEQYNPAALLLYMRDNTSTFRTLANISAEYNFTDNLSFKTVIGVDKSTSSRKAPISSLAPMSSVNGLGRAQVGDLDLTTKLLETYFNYSKDLSEDSNFTALLGFSYQEFNEKWRFTEAAGFRTENLDLMINNLGAAKVFSGNSSNVTDELQSFFGRLNYSYKGKYLLTATLRADGSTKFGPDKKYGYFPSFAAAWKLSEEDFVGDAFSDLKLRLGYGVTGNQEIPTNLYAQRTRFGTGNIGNDGVLVPGGESSVTFTNPGLQWEETSQINIGLDYGFMDNRITGSVDYYRKNTSDLLIKVTSAQPAATPFVWKNLPANVINQGLEFSINAKLVEKEKLNWNTNFNIAFNKNEVTNYNEAPLNTGVISGPGLTGAFAQQIADGQPLFAWYVREFSGYDANRIAQYEGGDVQKFTGDSPFPNYTLGFTNSLNFGQFDLNVFFAGQFGQKIYNNTANALFTVSNLSQGRNVTVDTGNLVGTEAPFNAPDVSTRFLEDGSFLRLQDVTLGYNLDLENSKLFKSFRIYANAQNLFVITNYSGQDPEVSTNKQLNGVPSAGIDYTSYPKARTITLGLNVTF